MSDDQDGCEWVVPDKRPLNGCVCACNMIKIIMSQKKPGRKDVTTKNVDNFLDVANSACVHETSETNTNFLQPNNNTLV